MPVYLVAVIQTCSVVGFVYLGEGVPVDTFDISRMDVSTKYLPEKVLVFPFDNECHIGCLRSWGTENILIKDNLVHHLF